MAKKQEPTFEEALLRLEEVVKQLESGGVSLDASLALYEEGVSLVRLCSSSLESAEQRVRVLAGGNPEAEPVFETLKNGDASNAN